MESVDVRFSRLAGELAVRFAGPPPDVSEVARLALEAFSLQFDGNAVYRVFCRERGVTPETATDWRDVPVVPADAFKHLDLVVGDPAHVDAVFHTSGTTQGGQRRGRHLVRSLELYRASLMPPIRQHLLTQSDGGDGGGLPFICLVPAPHAAPHSSLSWMVGAAAAAGARWTAWCVDSAGLPDADAFRTSVERAEGEGCPVLVLTTALALVHLLDVLEREGGHPRLPEGSRMMETGGFKGRSRQVTRERLYAAAQERLGIPTGRIVNEYGMTELLSQLYEPVLSEGQEARQHVPPWWLQVRALDPLTLDPLPEGSEGLLAFYDLANLGSVSAVLTQDVGTVEQGRVRLRGRAPRAEARGCSLAVDDLLAAAGRR